MFVLRLTLALLVTWIFLVNHKKYTFSADNFAIRTALFNGCSYFHISGLGSLERFLFVPENDSSSCQIIWTHLNSNPIARKNTDIVHPHFS